MISDDEKLIGVLLLMIAGLSVLDLLAALSPKSELSFSKTGKQIIACSKVMALAEKALLASEKALLAYGPSTKDDACWNNAIAAINEYRAVWRAK